MLSILLAASCSETTLSASGGADGFVPILTLDPMIVDFGAHAEGESTTATVTATNTGDETLLISSFALEGSASFTLLSELPASLAPGVSATIEIAFSPTSQRLSADLVVSSDAPATPVVRANLRGQGLYPALRVDPKPYDMGSVAPECSKTGGVALVNVGTAPLTVQSAVLVGDGFATVNPPAFPLTLAPAESVPLGISFDAAVLGANEAKLYVSSDDPSGVTISDLDIYVEEPPNEVVDELIQGTGPWDKTDIFVYVDQSGSMSDDQARLAANFSTFVYNLEATLTDWQLIVATNDRGCNNGGILTPYVSDAASTFTRGVSMGGGALTEAGLSVADAGLSAASGGCNAGFLRDDSKTIALLVSDEVEQSPEGWAAKTASMVATAPTVSVMSIVGPSPRGCSTAELGSGYIEASALTGGAVYSICESDWADYFTEIVQIATLPPVDRLVLSWPPVMSTLTVTLDGDPWTEWQYDAAQNALLFNANAIPGGGQRVEASYLAADDDCN